MNKKGSLSLSVNAIVVLILAITMLGLGLGFMKGMFGKVTDKIDTAIDSTDIKNPPSAEEPITISTRQLQLSRSSSEAIVVAYYNSAAAAESVIMTPTCDDGADPPVSTLPTGVTIIPDAAYDERTVAPNSYTTWQFTFSASANAASAGTGSCSFTASGGAVNRYMDVFVTVK